MLQKIDTLYLFIGRILDVVAMYLLFFHNYHVSHFFHKMFHKFSHYILGSNVSRETLCSMIFL